MILYHGTNKAFDTIDLTKSKPNKDFGQGFYLSREYSQAMAMAKTKYDQIKAGFPTVLTYLLPKSAICIFFPPNRVKDRQSWLSINPNFSSNNYKYLFLPFYCINKTYRYN